MLNLLVLVLTISPLVDGHLLILQILRRRRIRRILLRHLLISDRVRLRRRDEGLPRYEHGRRLRNSVFQVQELLSQFQRVYVPRILLVHGLLRRFALEF